MKDKFLHEAIDYMATTRANVDKMLSETDIRLNNVYHAIEVAELNHVSIGHKLAKELQEVLKERRVLKEKLAFYQSFATKLNELKVKEIDITNNTKRITNQAKASLKKILEKK